MKHLKDIFYFILGLCVGGYFVIFILAVSMFSIFQSLEQGGYFNKFYCSL